MTQFVRNTMLHDKNPLDFLTTKMGGIRQYTHFRGKKQKPTLFRSWHMYYVRILYKDISNVLMFYYP
jgi:hypothetical protein